MQSPNALLDHVLSIETVRQTLRSHLGRICDLILLLPRHTLLSLTAHTVPPALSRGSPRPTRHRRRSQPAGSEVTGAMAQDSIVLGDTVTPLVNTP